MAGLLVVGSGSDPSATFCAMPSVFETVDSSAHDPNSPLGRPIKVISTGEEGTIAAPPRGLGSQMQVAPNTWVGATWIYLPATGEFRLYADTAIERL